MHDNTVPHALFTLPSELHAHIFTLACTPSPVRSSLSGPSYYSAFQTSIALSLVSKYINAASAPARYHAVVLSSLREMLAFYHAISSSRLNSSSQDPRPRYRVRYMTLVTDEMPLDPAELVAERTWYPPETDVNVRAHSRSDSAATPAQRRRQRQRDARTRERLMLDVIAKILRAVGQDLHELEIGFQSIEHVQDPLAYLAACSPSLEFASNKRNFRNSIVHPLIFPNIKTMFYGCPPSGVYPWIRSSGLLTPSIPTTPTDLSHPPGFSTTAPTSSDVHQSYASTTHTPQPPLVCPRLKDLTVVCNDADVATASPEEGLDVDTELELSADVPISSTAPELDTATVDALLVLDLTSNTLTNTHTLKQFPSMTKLTVLASSPAQALSALDADEDGSGDGVGAGVGAGATWEVGTSLQGVLGVGKRSTARPVNNNRPNDTEEEGEEDEGCAWPPRELRTVVMRPKARWNERWESLREVVKREMEDVKKREEKMESTKRAGEILELMVLKPGEELS